MFVIPSFAIGGVTSSLYAFLSLIDKEKYDVYLFCRNHTGPLKETFEKCCTVIPENIWLSVCIVEGCWLRNICCLVLRCFRGVLGKLGVNLYPIYGSIGGKQIGSKKYDVVVSFHEGLSPIVCFYPAKRHIAWIHCDYRRYLDAVGRKELREYALYDKIICVSEFVKNIFSDIYPSVADKVFALHNVVDKNLIYQKAKENINDLRFDSSCFTIVSIGRLDPVKQFERIPAIAAEIKRLAKNRPFKWYIIGGSRGFADAESRIKSDINERHLNDTVILLGEKNNVYPYLAKANLLVCTSLSESFPMVVQEAKALNIPVVSNNFPSVFETIEDNVNGIITNIDTMPKAILRVINGNLTMNDNAYNMKNELEKFQLLFD